MQLHPTDLKEIEDLVRAHCEGKGLTPKGYRLNVEVTLESEFSISITSGISLTLLKENPRVLWKKDRGNVPFYGARISNILVNSNITSMYQLVTKRRADIIACRNSGQKCLRELESWLATFGLHFEMVFPDHIAKEFPEAHKSFRDFDDDVPIGLADLIAQNLGD